MRSFHKYNSSADPLLVSWEHLHERKSATDAITAWPTGNVQWRPNDMVANLFYVIPLSPCRSTPATKRIGGPVGDSSTDAKQKDKLRKWWSNFSILSEMQWDVLIDKWLIIDWFRRRSEYSAITQTGRTGKIGEISRELTIQNLQPLSIARCSLLWSSSLPHKSYDRNQWRQDKLWRQKK